MAFNVSGLALLSQSPRQSVYVYETTDSLSSVMAAGYFDALLDRVRVNDRVNVEAADGNATFSISISGRTVTTVSSPSAAVTHPALIAAIGSSSIARGESNVSGGYIRTWAGVVNAGNIMSGGRFYCPQEYSRAVSGAVSADMATTQLAEVLALSPRPRGCYVQAGTNDVRNAVPWETLQTNVENIVDTLLAAGITPIVGVPQATIGDTAEVQRGMARVARFLRDLVAATPGAILVDPTPGFLDPTLTTYESLNAYMDTATPRLHLNHYGTQIAGKAIVAALDAAGWAPNNDVALRSNGDLYDADDNPHGALMANGMFAGTSGITTGPATGTTPTGWTLTPTAVGGTVTISQPASGSGCTATFSGTATASANSIVLFRDFSAPELAQITVGDTLELVAEASWGALTNVLVVQADLRITMGGATTDDIDGGSVTTGGPFLATDAVFRPVPRLITATPTAIRARLLVYPLAAGTWSGDVTWKSCAIRRR